MEAQFRGDLNTIGSFCITVPLAQIAEIIAELQKSNQEWDRRAESDPQAPRELDVRRAVRSLYNPNPDLSQLKQPPFVLQECVLLVLRPVFFLPENYPLLIKTDLVLRTPGGPKPARSGRSSWVHYYLKPNSPFLVDSSGSSWSKFNFKSLRREEDYPSVFSLLVNANLQLQSVKRRTNNDILHTYISSIQDALAAIFHVPRQVHSQESHQTPPASDSQTAHNPTTGIPGPPNEPDRNEGDLQRNSSADPRSNSQGNDFAEGGRPNSHMAFEDPDYDDDDDYDDEDEDESDTINGLTFPEMEAVMQRVSDGSISDQERAEAAMVMLGMAGGKPSIHHTALFCLSKLRAPDRPLPPALSPLIRDDGRQNSPSTASCGG